WAACAWRSPRAVVSTRRPRPARRVSWSRARRASAPACSSLRPEDRPARRPGGGGGEGRGGQGNGASRLELGPDECLQVVQDLRERTGAVDDARAAAAPVSLHDHPDPIPDAFRPLAGLPPNGRFGIALQHDEDVLTYEPHSVT